MISANTRAEKLETEGGKVSGVVASHQGLRESLRSRLGVVIATGGFLRRTDWIKRFCPQLEGVARVCAPGADGDGISMALPLKAGLKDMQWLHPSFGFSLFPSTVNDFTYVAYSGAIIVNRDGLRFVNESAPYTDLGRAALAKAHNKSFLIFDDSIRRNQMAAREVDSHLLAKPIRDDGQQIFYQGSSITDVAIKAGLKPSNLTWTVTRYNQFVASGHDADFGRDSLTFGYGKPVPIVKPPFYVMPALVGMMGSYCGLSINRDGAVLTASGQVIPGLFAAGEVTGGFHGESFIGGTPLGKALIFGWIVGNTVGGMHA